MDNFFFVVIGICIYCLGSENGYKRALVKLANGTLRLNVEVKHENIKYTVL